MVTYSIQRDIMGYSLHEDSLIEGDVEALKEVQE